MPLPGLEHSDERPPDARFPTLPDAHGRLAHLRAHAPRLNERREQSQQHHRVTVWCGQPGHRREFAPAVSASTSVYGMMLPRPLDRSSHLPAEHRLEYLISQFCTFSIVTEGGTLAAHGLREPGRVYECRQKSGSADRAVLASDRYAKLAFVPPIYPPTGTHPRAPPTPTGAPACQVLEPKGVPSVSLFVLRYGSL